MSRPDDAKVIAGLGAGSLPFFAEYAYFLWGEVNYDSDGDCARPTDRAWSELHLQRRSSETPSDRLDVRIERGPASRVIVSGSVRASVELAGYLTALRSGGTPALPGGETAASLGARLADADRAQRMFLDPALAPFDGHAWWGGWKWCGDFSTDMTSGLREVLKAVHRRRVDPELIRWLREWQARGPAPFHREGVEYALRVLTS